MLFPLLQLPSSSLKDVLKSMDLVELIAVSTISKKAKDTVRFCMRETEFNFKINFFGEYISLDLSSESDRCVTCDVMNIVHSMVYSTKPLNHWKLNDVIVPARIHSDEYETIWKTFWRSETEGFRILIHYFANIFQKLTVSLDVQDQIGKQLSTVLKFIEHQNPGLKVIRVDGRMDDNAYKKVLDFCKKVFGNQKKEI